MDTLNEDSKGQNTSSTVRHGSENSHNQDLNRPLADLKADLENTTEDVWRVQEEQLTPPLGKSPREIFAREYKDPSQVTLEEELEDGKFRLAQHLARTKR